MRKIFTLLLSLVLLPLVAWGTNIWDGTTEETGWYTNGPEADGAYHISTAAELAGLAKLVNGETEDFNGKTIKLTADIQLNNTEEWENWDENTTGLNEWTPIGRSAVGTYFQGSFDGQGHTISGIYINEEVDNQGLFGFVTGGTIQNVNVAKSYIRASRYVGGIVGYIEKSGTVLNCSNSGTVIGTSEANAIAGGIVGYNNCSTVSNCPNSGTVEVTGAGTGPGYPSVGGIVGYNYGDAIVSNCSNSGTVTGTGDNACIGGIVGYSNFICVVSNSSNTGKVSGSSEAVGGIVGSNTAFDSGSVTNSYYLDNTCDAGIGSNETEGAVPPEEEMEKSDDKYTSGEVAYLLQGEQTEQVWGQRIGTDDYPVQLSLLSAEDKANYKVYAATFIYTIPGAEGKTEIIKYGNSGMTITIPTVTTVEGYTFTWDKEVQTQFGTEDLEFTGTFTLNTYTLTLTQPEGGTITAKVEGEEATENVKYGATVTLEAEASADYVFTAWSVTANGTEITVTDNTFEMPASDVTVTATFTSTKEPEPEPEEPDTPVTPDYPDYYNIYVEECEGVTVETSTNVVREGNSMSFTIDIADGYTAENMVVKMKRSLFGYTEILEPNEEGKYEIRNIYTEIYITVEGVEKETPTGIEELQSTKVYAQDGSLYVQTSKQEQVQIISISGAVLKNETQIGLKRYDLPRGIYIVRVGEETYKVRN